MVKPLYIHGRTATDETMEEMTVTQEEMHKVIDKFLDKDCTVITIMKGYPGAP